MASDLAGVLADLRAESEELDTVVAALPPGGWGSDTPAAGWTVAHQVSHLAWTDAIALLAITDPEEFGRQVRAGAADPMGMVEAGAAQGAAEEPAELLARWRSGRSALAGALAAATGKLVWFGPPMSPMSMATARLMETWAHSQDVFDGLGVRREPTARLRHVAHLGVRTRDFAYLVHGRTPPAVEFRVELTGPGGQDWTWGPADAAQRVTGPALDFCLLVTQRAHRVDLALVASGAEADAWLDIAQAFAGPPGSGRAPAVDAPADSDGADAAAGSGGSGGVDGSGGAAAGVGGVTDPTGADGMAVADGVGGR